MHDSEDIERRDQGFFQGRVLADLESIKIALTEMKAHSASLDAKFTKSYDELCDRIADLERWRAMVYGLSAGISLIAGSIGSFIVNKLSN